MPIKRIKDYPYKAALSGTEAVWLQDGTGVGSSKYTLISNIIAHVPAASWGSITGTLSAQTDLQAALNARQMADPGLDSLSDLTGAGYVKAVATDSFGMFTIIPFADMEVMPAETILGNRFGASAAPTPMTAAQALTLIGALGATAKAADSELIDGIDSTRIPYGSNSSATTGGVTDLNTPAKSGFYERSPGSGVGNSANGADSWNWFMQVEHTNVNGYGFQLSNIIGTNDLYIRHKAGGVYVGWDKFWHSGNFDPSLKQNVNATLSTLISNPWSTNAVPVGLGATSMNQITLAANNFLARASTGNAVAKSITDAALEALANMTAKTSWTPTVVGMTVTGTGTYTQQQGTYIRIGKLVFFKLWVAWTAHTGSGVARITLPIAAASDTSNCPVVGGLMDNYTVAAGSQYSFDVLGGTNYIRILATPSGGGTTAGQALDTSASMQVAGFYFTD